ncbi:hypothetical protein [Streptomyces sp. CC224B]|uniref:hypothetical protein n=1 Tax=Streptomyces sp. CC224B TaxID=3044571 RepID=UPI0024A82C50|nr:hypothetical protein [Streptomyces sp. CC224B]
MADVQVDELLHDVPVRLPSAAQVRARGGRRRTRRRAAGTVAAVAAATAGVLVWAGPPGGGADGREVRPAGRQSGPALVVDGMPRILPADEVPGDDRWHWRAGEEDTEDSPLPRVADGGSCPDSFRGRKAPDHVQYSTAYYSNTADAADASASHRVVSYASREVAARERAAYERELVACGLTYRDGAEPHWSGTATGDGARLHVTVQQDGGWLSVVEVRASSS